MAVRKIARRKMPRAARERQMLDAAARVFGRDGFQAAAMDEIAHRCGVTKPMLYAYFKSKEGLYLATVDRMGGALLAAVEGLLAVPDPYARLRRGVEVILGFIDHDRHGWAVLFAEGLGDGPVARHVARYRERRVALVALTLAQAAASRPPTAAAILHAEPYAVGLLGSGEALARWWLNRSRTSFDAMRIVAGEMVQALALDYARRRRA